MKVLHLFSNWKWTGPAEHALNLVLMLGKRGYQVSFLSGKTPKGKDESLEKMAKEREFTPDTRLNLKKHFNIDRVVLELEMEQLL